MSDPDPSFTQIPAMPSDGESILLTKIARILLGFTNGTFTISTSGGGGGGGGGGDASAANQVTGNGILSNILIQAGNILSGMATAALQGTANTLSTAANALLTSLVAKSTYPISTASLFIVGSANADVSLVIPAAGAGLSIVLEGVNFSYSIVPTTGRLTIADGATVFFDTDITGGGAGPLFGLLRKGSPNTAMTIKLFAGGNSGNIGKLNALKVRAE